MRIRQNLRCFMEQLEEDYSLEESLLLHIAAAHKRQKIAESLQQSSLLFQRDFKFEDDSSLSTSVIMINDRLAGDKTLGVGLSYNFNL